MFATAPHLAFVPLDVAAPRGLYLKRLANPVARDHDCRGTAVCSCHTYALRLERRSVALCAWVGDGTMALQAQWFTAEERAVADRLALWAHVAPDAAATNNLITHVWARQLIARRALPALERRICQAADWAGALDRATVRAWWDADETTVASACLVRGERRGAAPCVGATLYDGLAVVRALRTYVREA